MPRSRWGKRAREGADNWVLLANPDKLRWPTCTACSCSAAAPSMRRRALDLIGSR
jgi:hypothetical protein